MSADDGNIFEENGSSSGFRQDMSPIPHASPIENRGVELDVEEFYAIPHEDVYQNEDDSCPSEVELLRNQM